MTRSALSRMLGNVSVSLALAALGLGSPLLAQQPSYGAPGPYGAPGYSPPQPYNAPEPYNVPAPTPPAAQAPSPLSAAELQNLVAPVALYPDALLSQVLVASTYPLELVEAQQWVQQNRNLQGRQLLDAAKQQNWDPSVQALVTFPDAMALLNGDIHWTTGLGNAFLAQQADVMNAIQYLRAQAQADGRLANTPQLLVNTEVQGAQSAIQIAPANPQVMYVPVYDPNYVWGPPVAGYYPPLPYRGSGLGFGALFGAAVNLAEMFTGFPGIIGLKGWGWAISWLAHTLFLNNSFFSLFGFPGFSGGGYAASTVWMHDPVHRLGVPYAYGFVTARHGVPNRGEYGRGQIGTSRMAFSARTRPSAIAFAQASRPAQWASNREPQFYQSYNRSANTGYAPRSSASASYRANEEFRSRPTSADVYSSHRNSSSALASRSIPSSNGSRQQPYRFSNSRANSQSRQFASAQHASKPQHYSAPHYSAPHSGSSHKSGHSSGGHSSGGHSSRKSHGG